MTRHPYMPPDEQARQRARVIRDMPIEPMTFRDEIRCSVMMGLAIGCGISAVLWFAVVALLRWGWM